MKKLKQQQKSWGRKASQAIELGAGFGIEGVARVSRAVEREALVGVVRFDLHPAFSHQSGDSIFQGTYEA